jgi:intracellular multiplication protein IcmK
MSFASTDNFLKNALSAKKFVSEVPSMNRKFQVFALSAFLLTGTSGFAFSQDAQLLLPPPSYNQGQQAVAPMGAVGQIAPFQEKPKAPQGSVEDEQFQEALKSLAPMSPTQIEEMRRQLDARDRAQGVPLSPVQPMTRSVNLSMRPGEMPPVIRVAPGWVTTLTFSDVTGAPWPVMNFTVGNEAAYDVLNSGEKGKTNIVTITTKQAYVPSNLAVTLINAKVPLMLTLDPTGSSVDFRVDAQVSERGPNSKYDQITSDNLPPTSDSTMLSFLDGVAPDGARRLKVADRELQAWRYNDLLYVRTSRTMLSPAYTAKQSNVSGVNVYVLNEVPVLLLSDDGRMFSVQIQR